MADDHALCFFPSGPALGVLNNLKPMCYYKPDIYCPHGVFPEAGKSVVLLPR